SERSQELIPIVFENFHNHFSRESKNYRQQPKIESNLHVLNLKKVAVGLQAHYLVVVLECASRILHSSKRPLRNDEEVFCAPPDSFGGGIDGTT
ncbi:hypothetical protein N9406_10260, partial [Verrucomicrobiales bacterium]|nr:hypothetical protein [Verrucomicrobiales bacterium]